MSDLEVSSARFPQAIPNHLAVGDNVRLTVTGRIIGIREDAVDFRSYGGEPELVLGNRIANILVLDIQEPA